VRGSRCATLARFPHLWEPLLHRSGCTVPAKRVPKPPAGQCQEECHCGVVTGQCVPGQGLSLEEGEVPRQLGDPGARRGRRTVSCQGAREGAVGGWVAAVGCGTAVAWSLLRPCIRVSLMQDSQWCVTRVCSCMCAFMSVQVGLGRDRGCTAGPSGAAMGCMSPRGGGVCVPPGTCVCVGGSSSGALHLCELLEGCPPAPPRPNGHPCTRVTRAVCVVC